MKDCKKVRVFFAASGTGGHLHPAQAIAAELAYLDNIEIIFAGHQLSLNPYFERKNFSFIDVKAPLISLKNFFVHIQSACKFYRLLRAQKDLVIGFGSIYTLPIMLACFFKRCPYILFNSDAVMGKVQKLFFKNAYANLYFLFSLKESSLGKFQKVQMPLLLEKKQKIAVNEARALLGLEVNVLTCLVFGGSQGAVSMNELVIDALCKLRKKNFSFQVIHLIGQNMDEKAVKEIYAKHHITCSIKKFEKNMGDVYSATDIAICRSGSSAIAEILHHEIPALFIPYPFLKDQHQKHNAEFIQQKIGGGDWIIQNGLTSELLLEKLELLIQNKELFKHNLRLFNHRNNDPTAAEVISRCLHQLFGIIPTST